MIVLNCVAYIMHIIHYKINIIVTLNSFTLFHFVLVFRVSQCTYPIYLKGRLRASSFGFVRFKFVVFSEEKIQYMYKI